MIFIIEIDCLLDDIDIFEVLRKLLIGKGFQIVVNGEELNIWEFFSIFSSFFPMKVAHYEFIMSLTTHSDSNHITLFRESLGIVKHSLDSILGSVSFSIFCGMIFRACLALYDDDVVHISLREIYEELRFPNSFSSF